MTPREQRQWLRLRELRVQRAREQLAAADAACAVAHAAVLARQQAIERDRADLLAHAHAGVGAWAVHLPRWGDQYSAHRDRLAERLERDEYALIDEERTLEQAQELRQEKRAALSRARAREGAVQTLVEAMGVERTRRGEARAEIDSDERSSARAGGAA